MISVSRRSIVNLLVVVAIVATLPAAIRRLVETGDPYLFSQRFFADLVARLSGPGRLRFILQPAVAIVLGSRDGWHDARAGAAPFLWALVSHSGDCQKLMRHAFASVRDLVAIAILLDIISQFLIFHEIHPGAAILVGPVLIGVPYALSRAFTTRITRRHASRTRTAHTS